MDRRVRFDHDKQTGHLVRNRLTELICDLNSYKKKDKIACFLDLPCGVNWSTVHDFVKSLEPPAFA